MEVFKNVEENVIQNVTPEGTSYTNLASVSIGTGSQVFRSDQQGIWLGAAEYVNAPFRVDMQGNLIASSANLSGTGYTKTVTFAQASIPTSVSIGDLWVDTDDSNKMYRAASVGADQITAGEWVQVDQDTYKLNKVGGTYTTTSTAAAAKVQILPDANTGLIAYTTDGTTVVFKVEVGGTNVGDVTIGNYAGGTGMLWDQSAGNLIIKGDMTAGNITGVNIATASSGTRVAMTSSSDSVNWYDSGNDIGMTINLESTTGAVVEAKDSRSVVLKASSGYINFNDHILRDLKFIEFNQKTTRPSDNDGIWYYVSSGGGSYEFRSRMEGGNWKFDQTAV